MEVKTPASAPVPKRHFGRILVTGGSGFIGTNLIEALLKRGSKVLNLSRGEPRCRSHIHVFRKVDILDAQELKRAVMEFSADAIIHLAAKTGYGDREDTESFTINTKGTENILYAAECTPSVTRLVAASSFVVNAVMGKGKSTYSRSKKAAEEMCNAFNSKKTALCIVRPCSIWGPWFGPPFLNFFRSITRGRYIHLGEADSRRYTGFVGNTVYQIMAILESDDLVFNGKLYYLSDYEPLSIRSWATEICRALGRDEPASLPEPLVRIAAGFGDMCVRAGVQRFPLTTERLHNMRTDILNIPTQDIRQIAGELPFSTHEGIMQTLQWMKAVGIQ